MTSFKTPKGTELPFLNLKGKDYLQVMHRLVWFREEHPDWSIVTSFVQQTDQYSIARAEIHTPGGQIIATAHKREDAKHFPDHNEKSETGAIGRALALCGYGTQFAPELDEEHRIVDSPTPPKPRQTNVPGNSAALVSPVGPKPGREDEMPPTPTEDMMPHWPDEIDVPTGVEAPSLSSAMIHKAGEYVIPFGRDKGKRIRDLSPAVLEESVRYWINRSVQEGKDLDGKPGEFVDAAKVYMGF